MTDPFESAPRLRTVADHQFGRGAGAALFPADGDPRVKRTASGRVGQVHADDGRLVTRGTDGRFTLGLAGGRRLRAALDPPACRVVVGEESESFVRDGANAFAKFVRTVDPAVRPRDEVLVVGGDDRLFGVGRAAMAAAAMAEFGTGVAVETREGDDDGDGNGSQR